MIYDILITSIFVLYVGVTRWKFGSTETISATYYRFATTTGKLCFTLFCWGMATLLAGGHIEQGISQTYWFYVPSVFLFMLGAAPAYKDKFIERWHIVGAVGGIVTATACLLIVYHSWWIVASMILLIVAFQLSRLYDKTWWIEVISFIGIMIGLFIK